MPDRVTAWASVGTATPDRYAKQLASHLGRRCEVREEVDGIRIVFPDGDCLLVARQDILELRATADGEEHLDRVASVVGSHLERFGRGDGLAVRWEG